MRKYALLEKARLENDQGRAAEARATLERIKNLPGEDSLIEKKVTQMESLLSKAK